MLRLQRNVGAFGITLDDCTQGRRPDRGYADERLAGDVSCGRIELRAANAWSRGISKIRGSLRSGLNFTPGACFSGRIKARSILPRTRPAARSGESWLWMTTSVEGNSACRISITAG